MNNEEVRIERLVSTIDVIVNKPRRPRRLVELPPMPSLEDFTSSIKIAALKFGWHEDDKGNLEKHMDLKLAGIKVSGTASIDVSNAAYGVYFAAESIRPCRISGSYCSWTADERSAPHPHVVEPLSHDDEDHNLCYRRLVNASELRNCRLSGILPEWLIGSVEAAYLTFNPSSFANSSWNLCPACKAPTYMPVHRCPNLGRNTGPTLAKFPITLLVGCGVTGSWSAPVLSRVSRLLMIYDADVVDRFNPSGRWSVRLRSRMPKVEAAVEPRYDAVTVPLRHHFTPRTQIPHVNLVVLATDSAPSRIEAVENSHVSEAWIVDLRVASGQLVVWAFAGGSEMAITWYDDLRSYLNQPQPCGREHDNVPLVAGLMAASFLSWWTTREPEAGIWTIPFDQPWENMMIEQQQETPNEEMIPYEEMVEVVT